MKMLSVVGVVSVQVSDAEVAAAGVDSGLGAGPLHHVGRVVVLSELPIVNHGGRSVGSLALSPTIIVGTGPDTADNEDDDDDGHHGAGVAAPSVNRVNVIGPGNSVGNCIIHISCGC